MVALKLKEDDTLGWAVIHSGQPDSSVVIATSAGRALRLPLNSEQVPVMGRASLGNQALRLRRKETIVGMAVVSSQDAIIFVSAKGYAKRMPASAIRLMERGNVGIQALQFKLKSDSLVGMMAASAEATVGWATNKASGFTDFGAGHPPTKSGQHRRSPLSHRRRGVD